MPFIASIIAFPGWDVKIEHGHHSMDVVPCNPKQIHMIFNDKRRDVISPKMFKQICEAIEEQNIVEIADIE